MDAADDLVVGPSDLGHFSSGGLLVDESRHVRLGSHPVKGVDQAVIAGAGVSCPRTGQTGETQIGQLSGPGAAARPVRMSVPSEFRWVGPAALAHELGQASTTASDLVAADR